MATPKFTARDIAHIRRTGLELIGQQIEETYDGPETIMTSLGYVEVWPEGDDSASVTMNRVNYSLEALERASKRKTMKGRVVRRKRPAAKNGRIPKMSGFAAIKRDKTFSVEPEDDDYGVFGDTTGFCYGTYSRESDAEAKAASLRADKSRSSSPNGRSRLKRTKLACARRARATRKGSSKAASRLATHCPKRRKGGK
jgi:hypothetical protein